MARRGVRMWVAAGSLVAVAGLSAAGGCTGDYDCADDVACKIINDDGTSNGYCWGECVNAPEDFHAPVLVWTGPELLAPSSCEDLAWIVPGKDAVIRPSSGEPKFLGRTAPRIDPACPKCKCTEPSCVLPAEVTVYSGFMCAEGAGETRTSFALHPGWDGACVSPGSVASGQIGSLSIGPVREVPCVPIVEEQPVPRDFVVDDVAISCEGRVRNKLCDLPGQVCLLYQPRERLPAPWRQCVYVEGVDRDCEPPAPAGSPWPTFSEKLPGFYSEIRAPRECVPCDCKPPEASRCEAWVSAYEDRTCTDGLVSIGVAQIPVCVGPDPDVAFGSLSATWLVNEPGRCTPVGGTPDRTAESDVPVTICCLPAGP